MPLLHVCLESDIIIMLYSERRPLFSTVVYPETMWNTTPRARGMWCTASNTVDGKGAARSPSTIVAIVKGDEGPYGRRP